MMNDETESTEVNGLKGQKRQCLIVLENEEVGSAMWMPTSVIQEVEKFRVMAKSR